MGPKVPDTDTEAELSSDEVQRAKSQPRGKTGLKLRLGVPSSQQASASQPSSEGRPLRTRNTTTPQGFQHTSAYDIYNPPVGPGRGTRNSVNTEATFVDPTALSRPGASSRRSHTLAPDSDANQSDLGGYGPPSDPIEKPKARPKKPPPASGSEFEDQDAEGESDSGSDPPIRAKRAKRKLSDEEYYEDEADAAGEEDDDDLAEIQQNQRRRAATTSSGRNTKAGSYIESDASDEIVQAGRRHLKKHKDLKGFVAKDEDSEDFDMDAGYGEKPSRAEKNAKLENLARAKQKSHGQTYRPAPKGRQTRNSQMATVLDEDDEEWTGGDETEGAVRNLRRRKKDVNYAIQSFESIHQQDLAAAAAAQSAKAARKMISQPKLPLNMTGRQLDRYFRGKGLNDSSDDDMGTPRHNAFASGLLAGSAGGSNLFAGGASGGGGMLSGTPNNFGKMGDAGLADTDPLLPAVPVTFDQVGGMEQHVQQLKEMVSLPLLYPEVFQRFAITPPRGVLFHGPPGTGKTLLARALAASCSTEGQKISFFMRKGADCLSKWVGEAERQLRLLFDEAKAQQPSIIFFDEIDGLAPVRSSKQEQIHASIVSTLLALMDGMDGRGQVVIIGATNRPDAVDPALRRPGRFDREFYFPLPNRDARRKIIDIHTKGWEPGLENSFKDQLAQMTKGYGGADMRALCTEAALNAVQRTYPQIYKSTDRLLIKPEEISVSARDFVLSAKTLIPSTARSTSSVAAPLPSHLQPLLGPSLDRAKQVLSKVLPDVKKVNILEEAQYVQDEGGFEHEQMLQTFEKMRVYRPRLVLHGEPGMGQNFIGPAVLQSLEGFHVQSIDLSTLVSDSSKAAEAAIVDVFTEAKRHKPSILYIPNLLLWATSVSDLVKATFKGLLDAIDPSEPILLMAVVDGLLNSVPSDVRGWFGFVKSNRVLLERPSALQRKEYFEETLGNISKTPKQFPDAVPKKKRKLPELPKAPPLPPRQPTEAELAQQAQADGVLQEYLKWKLGALVTELRKRFKRFCKPIGNNYVPIEGLSTPPQSDAPGDTLPPTEGDQPSTEIPVSDMLPQEPPQENGTSSHSHDMELDQVDQSSGGPVAEPSAATVEPAHPPLAADAAASNPSNSKDTHETEGMPLEGNVNPVSEATPQTQTAGDTDPTRQNQVRYVPIDLDVIHSELYHGRYFTVEDFLDDIRMIVNNASLDPDPENHSKASALLNFTIIQLDQHADPVFRADCQRMAARQRERRKAAKNKAKEAAAKANKAAAEQLAVRTADAAPNTAAEQDRSSLKRTAEEQHADDPTAKRVRIEEPSEGSSKAVNHVDPTPQSAPHPDALPVPQSLASPVPLQKQQPPGRSPLSNGIVYTRDRSESPTPGAAPPPSNDNMDAEKGEDQHITEPGPDPASQAEMSDAHEEPDVQEPDPPFVVPHESLHQLHHDLEFMTGELTIDQLEQLRAALCDAIWRGRKDWDRSSLVTELKELVSEFLEECADVQAQDRIEDA